MVTVKFSDELFVPEDIKKLEAKEFRVKGKKLTNLELKVKPEDEDSGKQINFSWTVISFTEL